MMSIRSRLMVAAGLLAGTGSLLFAAAPAQAVLLAGWDNWADSSVPFAPDHSLAGFTASISQPTSDGRINTTFGSNDGSFGSIAGAALGPASSGTPALLVRTLGGNNVLTITLHNNTGQSYKLDSFHFDFAPRSSGSGPNHFVFKYASGNLGPSNTTVADVTAPYWINSGGTNSISDYPDYDYDLANYLTDITLDDGQSATFTLTFSGGSDVNTSSIVDNVAFIGSMIPEPASLALLCVAGGFLLPARRR